MINMLFYLGEATQLASVTHLAYTQHLVCSDKAGRKLCLVVLEPLSVQIRTVPLFPYVHAVWEFCALPCHYLCQQFSFLHVS
jgi:hypothetical protein